MTAVPIIVTAVIGEPDFGWLDGLRRTHFPAERNHLRAHLTLFHHLPPSAHDALIVRLREEARAAAGDDARITGLIDLGRGVAYRVESAQLEEARARIADHFRAELMPQDRAGWRAHVTVQNKVAPTEAKALLGALQRDFRPRALALSGLAAWWYRGGPWEPIAAFAFGTGRKIALDL